MINWWSSSYLIFMICCRTAIWGQEGCLATKQSVNIYTFFFPVPIGNYYTWLILFTQQAVVMVLTNIRCVRWAGFHNLVWALVYLISFNQFSVILNVIDISLSQPRRNSYDRVYIFHVFFWKSPHYHNQVLYAMYYDIDPIKIWFLNKLLFFPPNPIPFFLL